MARQASLSGATALHHAGSLCSGSTNMQPQRGLHCGCNHRLLVNHSIRHLGREVNTEETFTKKEGKCTSAYILCIFQPFSNISFAFNLCTSNDSKLQMY